MQIKRILFLALVAIVASFQVQAKKSKRPNVIVIYTDDHRYTGVHALGGQAVQTPHLDNLATNGIAFTNTYLMGAFTGATCIPSRAMLHTGRNLFQLDGFGYRFGTDHTPLAEAFADAGYHAHHVGKWHQDLKDLTRGYHSGGKVCGKPAYLTDQFRMPYIDWNKEGDYPIKNCYLLEYNVNGEVISRPLAKTDKRGPTGTEQTGPHVSEVFADDAIYFLNSYNKKKPFYMYLAFPCPHDPRQAPQKYHDMYPHDQVQLPPSYMSQHPFDNGHIYTRDEQLATWPRTPAVAKKHLAEYYAIITHLDAQIGRVIKALKVNGQFDNTLIIMAGDSGLGVGSHGLMGKQNVYDEDGIHVPFIISGGALNDKYRGHREDAWCYIHDIMPTTLDMAGVEQPESVTGKSLVPVLDGEVDAIRDYTYHAYRQHQRAYRKGDYKLIEYVRAPDVERNRPEFISGSRVTQLFNMKNDPWETHNLADFPEYEEKVSEMRKELKEKAVELNDRTMGDRTSYNFWDYYK